jgi:hypothetical protein
LLFDEDFELLREVSTVRRLGAGKDLDDPPGGLRQKKEALVVLGVCDISAMTIERGRRTPTC